MQQDAPIATTPVPNSASIKELSEALLRVRNISQVAELCEMGVFSTGMGRLTMRDLNVKHTFVHFPL